MKKHLFGVVVRLLATSPSNNNRLLYEHGYHAGNYADVVKHTALIGLLKHMSKKKSPFCYVETHSGAGGYALASKESQQMAEHEQGISTFLNDQTTDSDLLHPSMETLLRIMEQASSSNVDLMEGGTFYPGSPMIASALCREQDSLLLCEKETEQFQLLQSRMLMDGEDNHNNDRVILLQENGYKALKRFENLQSNKRALIFIDPPYQMGSDSEQIASLVGFLGKHWRSARVAIWHPVSRTNRERADRLYELVQKAVLGDSSSSSSSSSTELLATELYTDHDGNDEDETNPSVVGTGMLLVNPPFGIDEELKALYSSLGDALTGGGGHPNIMIKRL
ncbi:unnamed protein product [Cylindrotheca closterium]|uniref:23S rRNA (adenine(2030)-N6)-methyltransferase n=1 Tax=Cylindrotheca closterium TaxID=2856 RepID=A0AAD2GAW9_9STRA|nr:unnamed protein product [Cylindrotheca closterium]